MNIGAIILAAGASTRMGTSKQMLQINGEPLLSRTINAIAGAGIDRIVVVLGAHETAHRTLINSDHVSVVINERWQTGMGSSIKAGLQYLTSVHRDIDAVIISVCDQPMLNSTVISGIVAAYDSTGRSIIASGYSDSAGVPVLFARSRFSELNALPDDQGAKKILMRSAENDVVVVPFRGGEIDLDTLEDYQKFVTAGETDDQ